MSRARDLADLGDGIAVADLPSDVVTTASPSLGRRNLIINGAMQVAQRGTSGTSTADIYTVDRFALGHGSPVNAMSFEQSTDAPDNFKYSLKVTAGTGASASTTGYAVFRQAIEGQDVAHLGFGTSAAQNITLSFWVKSSLTGTFGVSTRNGAGNRGYGSTYAISVANTWEYKTISIPADTSGTWTTDSGVGLHIMWDLGAGSNYDIASDSWTDQSNIIGVESTVKLTETTGATWYITGVQLEVGSVATPFEHRSFGEELALCQRYYEQIQLLNNMACTGQCYTTSAARGGIRYATTKRASADVTGSGTFCLSRADGSNSCGVTMTFASNDHTLYFNAAGATSLVAGHATNLNGGLIKANAEL